MMMRGIVLALIALPLTAEASGWVQDRGSCYAKLWDRSIFGAKAYSAEGLRDTQDVPSYQDHSINLYGECGVHPRLTVFGSAAPFGYAKSGDGDTVYLGPFSAGLKVGLLTTGRLRLALSARYGYAPAVGDEVLSESQFDAGGGRMVRAIYQPAVENHLGELSIGVGVGFSLGGKPGYWGASLGARLNSADGVDHVLVATTQVGMTFFSRLALDLHFGLHEPFFQAVDLTNTAGVGQTRYLGFGLTASFWFIPQLAALVFFEGVFYAESNAATPSIGLGLESRFSFAGGSK